MDVTYYRDAEHNYMVIPCPAEADTAGYTYRMLELNRIDGLLPCSLRHIDGKKYLYYDVTGRQSLSGLFAGRKIPGTELWSLLHTLNSIRATLTEFLLDVSHLVLTPAQIYYEFRTGGFLFTYLPGEETEAEVFRFLADGIDSTDKRAAAAAYRMSASARDGGIKMWDELRALTEGEAPYGESEGAASYGGNSYGGNNGDPSCRGAAYGDTSHRGGACGDPSCHGAGRRDTSHRGAAYGDAAYRRAGHGDTSCHGAGFGDRVSPGEGNGAALRHGESDLRQARAPSWQSGDNTRCGSNVYGSAYGSFSQEGSDATVRMGMAGDRNYAGGGGGRQAEGRENVKQRKKSRSGPRVSRRTVLHIIMIIISLAGAGGLIAAQYYFYFPERDRRLCFVGAALLVVTAVLLVVDLFLKRRARELENAEATESYQTSEEEYYPVIRPESRNMDYRLDQGGQRLNTERLHDDREGRMYAVGDRSDDVRIDLTNLPLTIGKAQRYVDVVLQDPSVSRVHMRIFRQENGILAVQDLGSTNGTFINDIPIEPHKSKPLAKGDILRIGAVEYEYR